MPDLKTIDIIHDDRSETDLRAVWSVLTSQVYQIVDEAGEIERSRIRRLSPTHWLYWDSEQGLAVLDDSEAEHLLADVQCVRS